MDFMKHAFGRANNAVRANPITIWFPMLFGATVWIFYLLLFLVMVTPAIPDLMELDALTASGELFYRAAPATAVLIVVAVLVFMAYTAGVLGLRAASLSGGTLEPGHFFRSIKKYLVRLSLVHLGMLAVYAVPIMLTWLIISLGPWRARLAGADPETVFTVLSPFMAVVPLILAAVHIVLAMWPLVLVLEDGGVIGSLRRSLTFFRKSFRSVSSIILWGWAINVVSRMLLEGSAIGQLLHMGWSLVMTTYITLMLMSIYTAPDSNIR
ncbi:MAG TPA: hypothetical protein VK905_03740 [Bacillota bacterium]|nr:hypothetical protein [Bacillota bacterium]